METAAPEMLEMLIPTVLSKMHQMQPRELTSILMAYSEEGFFDNSSGAEDPGENELVVVKNQELLVAFEK